MGLIMTAPGPARPETPIAGLVELALTAPTFQQLIERAAARPA
jgi:transcription-repair coupling factor (superfamily II helicase)